MFRFLHSSDLHLGKPFGRFDEETRVRLREARHGRIDRLAEVAREEGATHVLLAGDTFDAETPPPRTVRQAMQAMAGHEDITWVLMPGNHDSLAATDLWGRLAGECPANLSLALEPEVMMLADGVALLPAPPTVRDPGRDLTVWMESAATEECVRIGLAHGGVQDFGEDTSGLDVIPPDRDRSAGLDYLALGDWHGAMRISPRCWYSGTPEGDNFKDQAAPQCLVVECPGRGAEPEVRSVETGAFLWHVADLDLRSGDAIEDEVEGCLPKENRRHALVKVGVSGRLGLSDQALLERVLAAHADDFAHFETDLAEIELDAGLGDLDDIDTAGALRAAADNLLARASASGGEPSEEAHVSRMALARLYQFAQEVGS